MRKSLAGYLIVLLVGVLLGGLGTAAYRSGKSADEANTDPIIAEVKGESVPASQAFKDNKRRIFELEDALFRIKRQSVNDYLENRLLTEESQRKGLPIDKLIVAAVGTEVPPVTDREIDGFLTEKGIQADTAEKKNEVREYLRYRKAAEKRHAYVETLRIQAKVKVYLEEPSAPRIKVDTDGYPSWGSANAPVTLIEFADFECPFCQKAVATLDKLKESYGPDKLRIVFRDLPIDTHERAVPAALAAHCAQEQGKFWEYYKALYENQNALKDDQLKDYAVKVGIEGTRFTECYDSKRHLAVVEKSRREADALGIDSTPSFIVNGVVVPGAQPFEVIKEKIEALLKQNT